MAVHGVVLLRLVIEKIQLAWLLPSHKQENDRFALAE